MTTRNPAETPRTPSRWPDHIDIAAHVRDAVRRRDKAIGELLASAWQGIRRRLASVVTIAGRVLATRRSRNAGRLPSLPAPHR